MSIVLYHVAYSTDSINIIINLEDYSKIKKYYQVSIIRFIGPKGIRKSIQKHSTNIIKLLLILLLIFFYTRIIIDIEILTNNPTLTNIIKNELDISNITKYSLIKSDKYISKAKENILKKHPDKLEWLNIARVGMKYIVNIEPKITKQPLSNEEYCHIVSLADATITKIYSSSGTEVKEINDTVKKGDILISGDITTPDATKGYTCATGTVYGNTWYTINIEIPREYEKFTPTGKKRTNITLKYHNKQATIFKSPFKKVQSTNKLLVSIFGFEFYLTKEQEVDAIKESYTEEELEEKINQLIDEKMQSILKGKSQIKHKKVLKKTTNDSTIYLDIFIVAEEEIGSQIIASKTAE